VLPQILQDLLYVLQAFIPGLIFGDIIQVHNDKVINEWTGTSFINYIKVVGTLVRPNGMTLV
jgi:hypothetical protein